MTTAAHRGQIRRIVVKVGTAALVGDSGEPDKARVRRIANQVAEVHERGVATVVVSSGAIAAGLAPLGMRHRPSDMPSLQAAAAVGQSRLMELYARVLEPKGIPVAQVLLTQYDIVHRRQYVNAHNTLERLLELGAVVVVNENDTVAVEEIRYGDNDRLAALVANLVQADLLAMLSDVAGVLTADPNKGGGQLISTIDDVTAEVAKGAARGRSRFGSGGMSSKLEAAEIATMSGVGVVIAAAAKRNVLVDIIEGKSVGTYFPPRRARIQARKLWIAWAPASRGRIIVDSGAVRALVGGKKSLLAAGVTAVEGSFKAGDAVLVVGPEGESVAKGLVAFDSELLAGIAGTKGNKEVIHRDQMVVL
jgi:glutamate 5-kinase